MTVNKSKNIEIPQWALSLLVSLLGAVFVFWGLWSTVKEKVYTNEKNFETLRLEKVDRSELVYVINQLTEIKSGVKELNTKLDKHITND